MDDLLARYPCREAQIRQLHGLLGYHKDEPLIDSLFINGGSSVGKTTITKDFLDTVGLRYAFVNLIECYTTKILLESILNQLTNHRVSTTNPAAYAKCDNMMEFIENLQICSEKFGLKKAVVVLDKAERIRDMDFNLLPSFMKLREFTGLNICVILLTQIVFQKFYTKGYITEPIKVRFPQYNKNEIIEILARDFVDANATISNNYAEDLSIDLEFYKSYLNVFLSVFYRVCRDLSELRYMSRINFVKYCEPVTKKECKTTDSMHLWRNISPILKSSLEVLYLRISDQCAFTKENLAQSLELPFYAKYLLIAAFLASYNPAKDDKRFFMKYHGKKTKTLKDVKAKSKVSELLNTQLGPKPFSLDRLLAIFYAILDDKVGFNNNLLVQVSSLVELQLLTALSDNCNLDGQKYKCAVEFEFVQTIAKMVGFNVRKYLSDFGHI